MSSNIIAVEQMKFLRHKSLEPKLLLRRDVDNFAIDVACQEVVDEFLGLGTNDRTYFQTETRGRSCFLPVESNGVLDIKGIGYGPAAACVQHEVARKLLSTTDIDEYVPILVCADTPFPIGAQVVFDQATSELAFWDVIAYGLNDLGDSVREFIIARDVYEPLGIHAMRCLALLSHDVELPWQRNQQSDSSDILETLFRANLREQNHPWCEAELKIPITHDITHQGGILVRQCTDEVRLQDLYLHAIKGQWSHLEDTFTKWQLLADGSVTKGVLSFVDTLAGTAALLINAGVIHCQLFYHLQNVTVPSGELCDFDHTVISPFHQPELAKSVRQTLIDCDKAFATDSVQLFDKMTLRFAPNVEDASSALVEQAFQLQNCAMRFVDIAERVSRGGTFEPGTVLESEYLDYLESRFVEQMSKSLDETGKAVLSQAALPGNGERYGFMTYTGVDRFVGSPSVLGWTSEMRPFDSYEQMCTKDDQSYITTQYRAFVDLARQFAAN